VNDVSEIVSTVGLRLALTKRDNAFDVIDLGPRSVAAQAAGVGIDPYGVPSLTIRIDHM